MPGMGVFWKGVSHLKLVPDSGCGSRGRRGYLKLLKKGPPGAADGVDYSQESVAMSRAIKARKLGKRRAVLQADVGGPVR